MISIYKVTKKEIEWLNGLNDNKNIKLTKKEIEENIKISNKIIIEYANSSEEIDEKIGFDREGILMDTTEHHILLGIDKLIIIAKYLSTNYKTRDGLYWNETLQNIIGDLFAAIEDEEENEE